MKKSEHTFDYQGKSDSQVQGNAQNGGCLFILFIIAAVIFLVHEAINFFTN